MLEVCLLSLTIYVSHSYVKKTDKSSISSGATFSFPFFETFNKLIHLQLDVSSSNSQESMQTYRQHVMKLDIFTMGGAPFTPQFNLTDWMEDIPSNMVTIDRYANPLSAAVASSLFPELLSSTTDIVSGYVHNAIENYINNNQKSLENTLSDDKPQIKTGTLSQCNDQNITLCSKTLAGVCQYCNEPKDCPNNFNRGYPAHIHEHRLHGAVVYIMFLHPCPITYYPNSKLSMYWYTGPGVIKSSEVKLNMESILLFGGYYSSEKDNPVTGTKSCKPYFKEYSLLDNNKLVLCLSTDYELAKADAIAFGGFFSCKYGNPYAMPSWPDNFDISRQSNWPQHCPQGYARHRMTTVCNCDIHVCLESGKFTSPTAAPTNIKLPPFIKFNEADTKQTNQDTESDGLRVKGPWGTTLVRSIEGKWEYVAPDNHCAAKRPKTLNLDDEK